MGTPRPQPDSRSEYVAEIERDASGKAARLYFSRVTVPAQPEPTETVTTVCSKDGCTAPVPSKRYPGGLASKFCSPACRQAAYLDRRVEALARQRALDFTQPAKPLPPVVDQRVPKQDRPGLCRMSGLILDRLREGSATASSLQAMFPGARSVRTRISDAKRWLEQYGETIHSARIEGTSDWIYYIESKARPREELGRP